MESSARRVELESTERILDDFFKVDAVVLRHEKFNGEMTDPLRRLNFERGDAVAAIVVERESADVLLTEQFRYPAYTKGDGWIIEAAAGMIKSGEDPEDTLRREIIEEMGYQLTEVEPIASFYVSPGGSSERIFLYYAEVSANDRIAGGGGLDTEGEDIRLVRIPLGQIDETIAAGAIADAKTLIGLMWLRSKRAEHNSPAA